MTAVNAAESNGPLADPSPALACLNSLWEHLVDVATEPGFFAAVAGLGAVGAVVVATVNLRFDYVARRDARVSALVSHVMSPAVTQARDLLTRRESSRHTAQTRHAAFTLLWTIERLGADLDAIRPSLASRIAYRFGRQPRQANGVEVLYANVARVTRCLNRYFRCDATNSYFVGSADTANRVISALPDWHARSFDTFPTAIRDQDADDTYRTRAIYRIIPPDNAFVPPRTTGVPNVLQAWQRDRRTKNVSRRA